MFICEYCGAELTTKGRYARHMRTKHGVEKPFEKFARQPEPFTVKPPEASEASTKVPVVGEKKKERREKKMEEAKYECGNCGYKFNSRIKFCPECGARFDWNAVEEA